MSYDLPKVKVLLSAYNGEQYIAEQIDSILNQTYPNIELYVRDDGSKDGTIKVLEPYVIAGKIHLEKGENVGFIKSFFWLIENCGDADFYSFADQDDVWFENKVELAVNTMQEQPESVPVLYYTNYDLYDGELNFKEHRPGKEPKTCFRNSLVDCVPLGFNTMFNRKACELTLQYYPYKSCGHDWSMYMLCAGLGKVIYDERATVKYRRHDYNVSNAGDSFLKQQIWRFKKFFVNNYFATIHEQIKEYKSYHYDALSKEDKKVLDLFSVDGFHPLITLKKVFYPHYYRQKWTDELMIRLVILIGRL